jgi:hypothetical protein
LSLLQIDPWFTKNTLERRKRTQCSPWAWRAARLAGIGRLRWRPWPGKGWGRTRSSGSICAHRRGRDALGGGLRRWPAVPAAGAYAPVEGRRLQCVQWHGEVVWGRVKLLGRLVGGGRVGISELAVGDRWRMASSVCAWAAGDLYSRSAPFLHDEWMRPP